MCLDMRAHVYRHVPPPGRITVLWPCAIWPPVQCGHLCNTATYSTGGRIAYAGGIARVATWHTRSLRTGRGCGMRADKAVGVGADAHAHAACLGARRDIDTHLLGRPNNSNMTDLYNAATVGNAVAYCTGGRIACVAVLHGW